MRRLRTFPILARIARLLYTPWQWLAIPPRRAPQQRVLMEFRGAAILVKNLDCEAIVTFRVDEWLTHPAARFIVVRTPCRCVQLGRRFLVRISTLSAHARPQNRQALVATLAADSDGTTIEMVSLAA